DRTGRSGRWLGSEAVPESDVGVDEPPARSGGLELLPELVDVDVDRSIAAAQRAAPDGLEERVASDDVAGADGERRQQLELADRQRHDAAGDQRQALRRPDL